MSMRLEFGKPPKKDWLSITLSIEGRSFRFHASGVVNDPLWDLLTAALWCLNTDYETDPVPKGMNHPYCETHVRGVHFWMEPAWHTLLVRKGDTSNLLRLRFYENHEGGLFVDDHDFCTAAKTYFDTMSADAFARMVYSSISDILKSDAVHYSEHFLRGFPHRMLCDLEAIVRQL